jgi:hypothetical protein
MTVSALPAVLLLAFNRPDPTRRVLDTLRMARVPRLYFATDAPRAERPQDGPRNAEVRALVGEVDWPCELRTLFRPEHLGLKAAVSSAIDWFFEHETEGVILEDDCLPIASFFPFCEELLARYRDDPRVAQVSGSNFIPSPSTDSYWATKYADIWGWATWRRAWRLRDMTMSGWPAWRNSGGLQRLPGSTPGFVHYWTRIFDATYRGDISTWDYPWLFNCWSRGAISLAPASPQVRNIGFEADATHTQHFDRINPHVAQTPMHLEFPLRHPGCLVLDVAADRRWTRVRYSVDAWAEAAALARRLGPPGRAAVGWAQAARSRLKARA